MITLHLNDWDSQLNQKKKRCSSIPINPIHLRVIRPQEIQQVNSYVI